jgi:hypothetical protein
MTNWKNHNGGYGLFLAKEQNASFRRTLSGSGPWMGIYADHWKTMSNSWIGRGQLEFMVVLMASAVKVIIIVHFLVAKFAISHISVQFASFLFIIFIYLAVVSPMVRQLALTATLHTKTSNINSNRAQIFPFGREHAGGMV